MSLVDLASQKSKSPNSLSGPSPKRLRTNSELDNSEEPNTKQTPSYVVHIRNLVDNVTEADISQSFENYGLIK